MKKLILVVCAAVIFHCPSFSQEKSKGRIKFYQTWVTTVNNPSPWKGILYEITDSSILVSNSKYTSDFLDSRFQVSKFDYHEIDLIRTRRVNNIQRGFWIGSVIGLVSGMLTYTEQETGMPYWFTTVSIVIPSSLFIGGIGALIGSVKARFPIGGSMENFNRNKYLLMKYSSVGEYTYESDLLKKSYEHKSFFSVLEGPSFPLGDFGDNSPANINADSASRGISGTFTYGRRFNQKIGMVISGCYSQYDVDMTLTGKWWGIASIMAGPMFSYRLKEKLFIDIKPTIGYCNAQSFNTDYLIYSFYGNGLGLNMSASLMYNFSKRWSFLSEAGYFYTNQKEWGIEKKIKSISTSIGVAYRFR